MNSYNRGPDDAMSQECASTRLCDHSIKKLKTMSKSHMTVHIELF